MASIKKGSETVEREKLRVGDEDEGEELGMKTARGVATAAKRVGWSKNPRKKNRNGFVPQALISTAFAYTSGAWDSAAE